MTSSSLTQSAKVREQLDHPVIDADGHWVELFPIFFDFIAEVGSPARCVGRSRKPQGVIEGVF